MIRVLALIDHLALGGAQMLLSHFAAAAPGQAIHLWVACLRAGDANPAAIPLLDAGLTPMNLEALGRRPGLATLRAVRQHIGRVQPDILHTHLGTSDWVGALAARSRGVPVVSTIHTAVWGPGAEIAIKRRLVRMCAARVIAVSDSASDAYRRRGWAREGQLVTIRNGVNATAVRGAGRELRAELGLAQEDLVVGMVSSLRPEKAHDVAIAAIRTLQPEFPDLRLLVVGEGPQEASIARLGRDLGDRIVMVGLRTDVMRCLDACDVCLHPSRADALPTTVIEAMAASVPVLATAVGGIPEIITDQETGILVPAPPSAENIAEALGALLRSDARRRELAASARVAYEQCFSADRWVRETREVYQAVLSESRAHTSGPSRRRHPAP